MADLIAITQYVIVPILTGFGVWYSQRRKFRHLEEKMKVNAELHKADNTTREIQLLMEANTSFRNEVVAMMDVQKEQIVSLNKQVEHLESENADMKKKLNQKDTIIFELQLTITKLTNRIRDLEEKTPL